MLCSGSAYKNCYHTFTRTPRKILSSVLQMPDQHSIVQEILYHRSKNNWMTSRVDLISTVYCFDNESFRFLAALQGGIKFAYEDEQSFAKSWKRSAEESFRFLKYFMARTPHKVRDTLSLNNTRKIVILLSKPLAEIGQLIQINISIATEQQNQIKN